MVCRGSRPLRCLCLRWSMTCASGDAHRDLNLLTRTGRARMTRLFADATPTALLRKRQVMRTDSEPAVA